MDRASDTIGGQRGGGCPGVVAESAVLSSAVLRRNVVASSSETFSVRFGHYVPWISVILVAIGLIHALWPSVVRAGTARGRS
jgi:hypothetical protein